MSYITTLSPLPATVQLEEEWKILEGKVSCSYFQSWGWISTWLEQIGCNFDCRLVRITEFGELVALGVLCLHEANRPGLVRPRSLFLNEILLSGHNMIVEYNGLLCADKDLPGAYKSLFNYLFYKYRSWDSFSLSMLMERHYQALTKELGDEFFVYKEKDEKAWYLDMSEYDQEAVAGLRYLSKNRRCQIRKSIRYFEQFGSITINEAQTAEQAMASFALLKKLHTKRWLSVGKTGSFHNPKWENFHQALIKDRFSKGEIQLLTILSGDKPIGVIYNFKWRDCILVLQTGFEIEVPKGVQSGYVSHVKAIEYNHTQGYVKYNLLSEDSGYKKVICNHSDNLFTITVKRKSMNSAMRQVSLRNIKSGYIPSVVLSSLGANASELMLQGKDALVESVVKLRNNWPDESPKYLLVGAESSGTTAISDLLFKELKGIRFLEEGDNQWVWEAYKDIYLGKKSIRDFPRLQLFDAIKVPGFSLIISQFIREFPNTKVVYIVRDPRDYASSAIKTWQIPDMRHFSDIPWTHNDWLGCDVSDPIKSLACRWRTYMNQSYEIPDVYYIKYEDFCADKVGSIARLCSHFDIPFNSKRVEELCDVQLSHNSVRSYIPKGPGGWRNSILKPEDIAKIEQECRNDMLKWGYELDYAK